MVVTANPHATRVGLEVLRAGGSAVDAAVAIEAVLTLVEPQSSGLAGGAYMVHYEAQTKSISVYDGRETAPASATKDMFFKNNTETYNFIEAKTSGLATGVPGVVAMLEMAHKDHGSLPWKELFESAHQLASDGFEVSPRLHGMIQRFGPYIPSTLEEGPLDAYNYFFDDTGEALPAGHILTNPEYAVTLDMIADNPESFYRGSIAEQIVEAVGLSPRAGAMTTADIEAYRPVKRSVVCSPYRKMKLCGPPPASSWVAVGMIMGLVEEHGGFSKAGADDWKNWALYADVQRLAYADRDHYIADADKTGVPTKGLLNRDYISERAGLLSSDSPLKDLTPGNAWKYEPNSSVSMNGVDGTDDTPGTTHFVIVDKSGDVVSMTASVESIFGSTRMVGGMFLNNQLTDFSFKYVDEDGTPIANAPGPQKRPRSSMSPTIILDENDEFLMATGSPGGNNIIAYTTKSIIGVLDWGLTAQQAIDLPNMVARGDIVRVEANSGSETLITNLEQYGFEVDGSRGENSGLSVVVKRSSGRLEGGVDRRREGVIGGE
ncbi:MAG: gamma-glutamyltransferase family protein [Pseudomonadales bacterium]